MGNYYKYIPVSDAEKDWGLWVLNAGFTHIRPDVNYPSEEHPTDHFFNWTHGRVLQEYQIIYITRGQGSFESNTCKERCVSAGSVIFLFPGEWHRYKPNIDTGWDEYWIGISGAIIDNLVEKRIFLPESPILEIGSNEDVFHLLWGIIENTKEEKPGYQAKNLGLTLNLLGDIYAINWRNKTDTDQYIDIINKSKILFRQNVRTTYSPQEAAKELMVSYSWFRKIFKISTGMSPGQYFLDLKVQIAKDALSNPDCSIKRVSLELQFSSVFHFSNFFKGKTGLSPLEYKNMQSGGYRYNKYLRRNS